MSDVVSFIPRSFGTHDGTFHADEVTACALLLLIDRIDTDKIYRSRDLDFLKNCEYTCDVGGIYNPEEKKFDHHQKEYSGPLSSAGMVLEYIKTKKLLPQRECDLLNNSLVKGVDLHDNGKDPQFPGYCFFSHIISNFAPIEYTAPNSAFDEAFMQAVLFAQGHIKRLLNRYRYNHSTKQLVEQAMATTSSYLLFDTSMPWIDSFFELGGERHPAAFVIMPSGGYWKVRGIPPTSDDRMKVRIPLPFTWAGLMGESLCLASGIKGGIFCHKGRFISVWETKEAALQAVERALHRT